LLNPFVRRVKRRIDMRMVRFYRSTNDVLTCLGSGESALQTWASKAALASFSSVSAEASERGISRVHPHAPQRQPVKDFVSVERNSRFAMSKVYAVRADVQGLWKSN
jgi:hypothetical protein